MSEVGETTAPAAERPAGYDVPAVEAWIADHAPRLKLPLKWTRLPGGHSNLTYLIEDQRGATAVIRRPPLGELLPKAHDMAREWALITALGPTAVPVPEAIAFCEDKTVTGAAFYVMGHVDGHPLYNADDTAKYAPQAARERLGYQFVEVLAELHALEPGDVGLSGLGKPENYVGRQLSAWHRSWLASVEAARLDDPRTHALHDALAANVPDQGPARIVHGDYGVHNCLVGPEGRIAAVVDWEISTLGDPLADLAYALNPWPDPTDAEAPVKSAALSVPGFPSRSQMAARYAEKTGRDLSGLDFYVAFARWKSACIVHGVYARYMEGKKGTEGVDLEGLRLSITRSLDQADQAYARWRARAHG